MKWYRVLVLVSGLFALSGIVYLGVNTNKLGIDFGEPSFISENTSPPPVTSIVKSVPGVIEKITTFDCAKTYDEMRDIYYNEWNPTVSINSATNYPVREKMAEKENLLLENTCMEKKEEWAYKSKYENEIWGIEEKEEITFSQCVEDYRSKYCLFYNEGDERKTECERQVYQNALDTCNKYR